MHSPRWSEGRVWLEGGRPYEIELQYFQQRGGAKVKLGFRGLVS